VIAFANTSGGNIYVGVQDDGSPQGEAAVRASFQGEAEAALEAQADRLKTLAREKIKPVPQIVVNRLTIHDHRQWLMWNADLSARTRPMRTKCL